MKILESGRVHTKQNICIVEIRKFFRIVYGISENFDEKWVFLIYGQYLTV
jgi:hypothetical protein